MDTRSITVTAVYALHRYSFFLKILKQNLWNKYFFPPQILLLMPSHLFCCKVLCLDSKKLRFDTQKNILVTRITCFGLSFDNPIQTFKIRLSDL